MSDQPPGGEPTEPPSEKRLRDAREKGDVPKSRELVSVLTFAAVAAAIFWQWPDVVGALRELIALAARDACRPGIGPGAFLELGISKGLSALAPILGTAFLAAFVVGYAQVGSIFTLHPLKPNLGRLNPIENAKNMWGKQALFELTKSVLKTIGIGYIAFDALWSGLPAILSSTGSDPERALASVTACLVTIAKRATLLMITVAAVDLFYQRQRYRKQKRMTKYEVTREHKDSEGDPQRKAERQRIHREIGQHSMLEQVAKADCVIINPDHIAVALCYDGKNESAPRIVAKGHRVLAAQIREIARQHGIPIIRNVPLARALVELELDDEIPEALYETVAEVLRFVYRLSGREL